MHTRNRHHTACRRFELENEHHVLKTDEEKDGDGERQHNRKVLEDMKWRKRIFQNENSSDTCFLERNYKHNPCAGLKMAFNPFNPAPTEQDLTEFSWPPQAPKGLVNPPKMRAEGQRFGASLQVSPRPQPP